MIRKSRLDDVHAIVHLIKEFASKEVMLPLSIGDATDRIRDFWICEEDGQVVGCAAVHASWEKLVELRSLAVAPAHQGKSYGRMLMERALAEAVELGADEIFTLTYIPDFFRKFGFVELPRQELPHKVWMDCLKCVKFPDCGETAMKMKL